MSNRPTRAWEKAYGLLSRVLASITYDTEEQAAKGRYALPIDVCELIDDFLANDCPPSIEYPQVSLPHYFVEREDICDNCGSELTAGICIGCSEPSEVVAFLRDNFGGKA